MDSGAPLPMVEGGAPPPPPGCDIKKLPKEDTCVLDESAGIFVSASMGSSAGDGTRTHPLSTIQAGIDAAKPTKRRVYVCAEPYAEQITIADGVSIFGDLSCAGKWGVANNRAIVKSPASPAVTAKSIASPTLVEGIEFVAPDTTAASASSIAMVAIQSPVIRLVDVRLHGGNAGAGAQGTDGAVLTDSGAAKDGQDANGDYTCNTMTFMCKGGPGAAGGTNQCTGTKMFTPGPGAPGGNGGGQQSQYNQNISTWFWTTIQTASGSNGSNGTGGTIGMNGSSGAEIGSFDPTALYVPSNGTAGTDGGPGIGGLGGFGYYTAPPGSAMSYQNYFHWGITGGGAGAGGCPGLAATEGNGGGASIALLAFDSPLVVEASTLETGAGGNGGAAGAPSAPMAGGLGGQGKSLATGGGNGGPGGAAGVSGNGGGGPSIAIASKGTAPQATQTTLTPGAGGMGVSARNVGIYTIPASPNGKSAATFAF